MSLTINKKMYLIFFFLSSVISLNLNACNNTFQIFLENNLDILKHEKFFKKIDKEFIIAITTTGEKKTLTNRFCCYIGYDSETRSCAKLTSFTCIPGEGTLCSAVKLAALQLVVGKKGSYSTDYPEKYKTDNPGLDVDYTLKNEYWLDIVVKKTKDGSNKKLAFSIGCKSGGNYYTAQIGKKDINNINVHLDDPNKDLEPTGGKL